ncbi:MAG: elongation factor G [Pseudomonadota bacterium]
MHRCIAVMGASGAGKSTLVDALCRIEGAPPPAAGPGETRIAPFSFLGDAWNAIDCPGAIDFLQASVDALLAADAALICVPPDPEAAVLTAPYLRAVEDAGTPAFLFITQMDAPLGRVRDIVAALQDYARHPLVLRQVPMREDGRVIGAVDLVSERAWRYRAGTTSTLVKIPEELQDRESEAREALLENLSDFDDWLMEEIIEDHAPAQAPVYEICARVLRENRLIPVLIGAAAQPHGVVRLMKALRHETPGPDALHARLRDAAGLAGADPILGAGFHAVHRRHVGRVLHMRSFSDMVKASARLGGQPLGSLVSLGGAGAARGDPGAGALIGAVKSDHLASGALYTAGDQHDAPGWLDRGKAQFSRILRPVHEKDDAKLSTTLTRLCADDRAISVDQDPQTGALRVATPGPLYLKAVSETLAGTFGISVDAEAVPPVYCEAITRSAEIHHRHRKQTGGAGQFADVKIAVAPAPRGAGFGFAETVKGGAVPRRYIPAVEAGARDALAQGPLGFPVIDLQVTLTDGQHHNVDSSDLAFRIAARAAVAQAMQKAAPVLLQPIHLVRFQVPSIFTGALVPVISSLKGQVLGFDRDETARGWDVFRALLPGTALDDLTGQIRAATQGVGRFEASLDHFEEFYGREADRISAQKLTAQRLTA